MVRTKGPVRGSRQLTVPALLRRSRAGNSLHWLVSQYGSRTSDILTTNQMRSICDSQIVPQACRATLKHLVSGLDWHLADAPEGGKDVKGTDEGDHYYGVLRDWCDAGGNTIGFSDGIDKGSDDLLTAREGACCEVVRDGDGVPQVILHVDAATIRFTGDPKQPVYQVAPWGEVSQLWEADRFMQIGWHPSTKMGMELTSRPPVQLAYTGIAILASSDTYNFKLITEPIPAGVLNLGPGFTSTQAIEWKAAWDTAMSGIRPDPLALIYGTQGVEYTPFRPSLKDMAFESSFHWYASLVAACFEISILDISILTRVATKAAAEEQAEATKRQGLKHLMGKWREGIQEDILPEGMFFIWEDIDPTDENIDAERHLKEAQTANTYVQMGAITPQQAFEEGQRMGHLDESLQFEAGQQMEPGLGMPEGASPSNIQALLDEWDEGGTLAEWVEKARRDAANLTREQAAQEVAEPLEEGFWEVDEAYFEELQARVREGMREDEG